jgi:acetate kinase
VSRALFQQVPALATGRIIIAHLGSGASLCALHHGKSIATTMGFSTLDGVMMATRCGALDPGVILHWVREGLDINTIEKRLYKESGLLGVSGISSNLQVLLSATEHAAQEAVTLFVLRCCEMIGSLAANLQGIDALVFTGGIGEHQAETRARIVQSLAWLGAKLDVSSNRENGFLITTTDSKLPVYVIATDEEQEMAQLAAKLLRP